MRPVLTLRCVALQCRAHVSHPVPPGELSTHVDLVLQFADSCRGHSSFCLKKKPAPAPPPPLFIFHVCMLYYMLCCLTCTADTLRGCGQDQVWSYKSLPSVVPGGKEVHALGFCKQAAFRWVVWHYRKCICITAFRASLGKAWRRGALALY